jgi:hypothetical protein
MSGHAEADAAAVVTDGAPRFVGAAAWSARYSLALAPVGDGDFASVVLTAPIARKDGVLRIAGRLADGRRVTAVSAADEARRYAVLIRPYGAGGGFVAGELVLEGAPGATFADEDSSGRWLWRRTARGASPEVYLELSPSLAP